MNKDLCFTHCERHPEAEPERKSKILKFRARDSLVDALLSAAHASGRSMAEECERRLLASFASEKPSLTAEDVRMALRAELAFQELRAQLSMEDIERLDRMARHA